MAWVRLDDGFSEHPKVVKAGPLGMALQIAALCYANRNLTDGFIPKAIVPLLVNFDGIGLTASPDSSEPVAATWQYVVEILLKAGLWEKANGGYMIHDYLDYQPSREDMNKARKENARRVREHRAKQGQSLPRSDSSVTPLKACGSDISETALTPHPNESPNTEGSALGETTPKHPREPTLDEILARYSRYDKNQLDMIREYWDLVRFTRKSEKIAGTVIAREMEYWERFPTEITIEALKIHVRKYSGKAEDYTKGIMRRLQGELERSGSYGEDGSKPDRRSLKDERRPGVEGDDDQYAEYDAVWRGP